MTPVGGEFDGRGSSEVRACESPTTLAVFVGRESPQQDLRFFPALRTLVTVVLDQGLDRRVFDASVEPRRDELLELIAIELSLLGGLEQPMQQSLGCDVLAQDSASCIVPRVAACSAR